MKVPVHIKYIFTVLLFIPLMIRGQDITIQNAIRYTDSLSLKSVDTATCERYFFTALKDYENANLEISIHSLPDSIYFQKTFWLLLEKETVFVESRLYSEGDFISFTDDLPKEHLCYDYVVKRASERYGGETMLYDYKLRADSLDSVGMGYVYPRFKSKNIYNKIKKKSQVPIEPENYKKSNKSIRAELAIDAEGNVTRIDCFKENCGPVCVPLLATNEYVIEVERITEQLGQIVAARFMGEPCSGSITLYFAFVE